MMTFRNTLLRARRLCGMPRCAMRLCIVPLCIMLGLAAGKPAPAVAAPSEGPRATVQMAQYYPRPPLHRHWRHRYYRHHRYYYVY